MMNEEKKVNEAVENEVLSGEVVEEQQVEVKKEGLIKRVWRKHKTKIVAAGAFGLGILVKTLISGSHGDDDENASADEPAYLPSGEENEI